MALEFTTSYLTDSIAIFRQYKKLGDGALAQVSDAELYAVLDPESNSLAVVMQHVAGNMRSRFTDFLTSDGEKSWRNRDAEFGAPPGTRMELLGMWESGWAVLFAALESLTEEQMTATVTIRGERHSVMQAIQRQVAHYSYHVGQMVFLAKHFAGGNWKTLSVARGESESFTRRVQAGEASQR